MYVLAFLTVRKSAGHEERGRRNEQLELVLGIATDSGAVEILQAVAHPARLWALGKHGSRVVLALAVGSPLSAVRSLVLTNNRADTTSFRALSVHVLRVAQALVAESPNRASRRVLIHACASLAN